AQCAFTQFGDRSLLARTRAQLILGMLALGDVFQGSVQHDGFSVVSAQDTRPATYMADSAVESDDAKFAFRRFAFPGATNVVEKVLAVIRMNEADFGLDLGRRRACPQSKQVIYLVRPHALAGAHVVFPASDARDMLGRAQMIHQVADRAAAPAHLAFHVGPLFTSRRSSKHFPQCSPSL